MSEAPGTGPETSPPTNAPASAPASALAGGRPARYPRTTNGLIGSLIVTLLAVGAFVALRALNRDDLEVKPTPVDYLSTVGFAQEAGVDLVYPASLPKGWIANSQDYVPGDHPAWGIGMLTDDGRFVGLRQEDAPLDDLLHTYVDQDPQSQPPVHVRGSVAGVWKSFSGSGGDWAYSAEVDGDNVLVYGSASPTDQRRLLELLTTEQR